jgi:hypothetical protein
MRTLVAFLIALPGCAAAHDPGTWTNPGSADAGADAPPPAFSDAAPAGDAGACSSEAQLVYVVDSVKNVYGFDPKALAFTPIGALTCTGSPTFSMAVDRNAVAYALGTDGTLVRYDIRSHACTLLPFASSQHGFFTFGMGFSSDSKGSSNETLFVASANSLGLATIDTTTLALTPVGKFDKLGGRVELTGTGDGQLFGLFEGTPYVVGEVDKATAQVLSQAPQAPTTVANFAFAFWGGDFYLFLAKDVIRYSPTKKTSVKVASVTFEIVGAGVSTCAPTFFPN